MSYQQKKTLAGMLTGAAVLAAYGFYVIGKYRAGSEVIEDLRFWAGAMLKFIGIGVAAAIVVQIVFHVLYSVGVAVKEKILNGDCDDGTIEKSIRLEMVEDERDRIIELKSMRFGFILAGAGFVGSLVSLVLGQPPAVMLNILFLSFWLGSIIEGLAQLYFYGKGVRNG